MGKQWVEGLENEASGCTACVGASGVGVRGEWSAAPAGSFPLTRALLRAGPVKVTAGIPVLQSAAWSFSVIFENNSNLSVTCFQAGASMTVYVREILILASPNKSVWWFFSFVLM